VRAIVLDDGTTQAAVVAWELIFAPDAVWTEVPRRVAAESGIRAENLLLAGVHDYGAPSIGGSGGAAATADYTRKVEDAAVEAVRRAKEHLQPARFGAGSGTAYINANRRELTPSQGWWLGFNENGVSDKTVAVLRFDDLSGRPIAFFINYPVHAVIMGPENYQITGDLAGATSRFVERHYLGEDRPRSDAGHRLRLRPEEKAGEGGVVAIWTSGAAGTRQPASAMVSANCEAAGIPGAGPANCSGVWSASGIATMYASGVRCGSSSSPSPVTPSRTGQLTWQNTIRRGFRHQCGIGVGAEALERSRNQRVPQRRFFRGTAFDWRRLRLRISRATKNRAASAAAATRPRLLCKFKVARHSTFQ
jgi:hypothetical protein